MVRRLTYPPRPQESPSIWSISRRMRAKLRKRSCSVTAKHSPVGYAARDSEAQRGERIRSTGWRGGTRPSGRSGLKVAQGPAQLERAEEVPVEVALLTGRGLGLCAAWRRILASGAAVAGPVSANRNLFDTVSSHLPRVLRRPRSPSLPLAQDGGSQSHREARGLPQLFESDFLNFFSRVHPAIPAIVFVPVIVLMEWLGAEHGYGAPGSCPA